MVHELILHPPPGTLPRSFDELQAALRETETLAPYVNEEASTPEALVLTDFDTGVWAYLAPAPHPEESEEEEEPGALLLQIPYLRPRFFAIEGALFATALQQEFGYLVEDPADERAPAARARREEEIVASWDAGNQAALAEAGEEFSPHRIDGELLNRVFSHNLHRTELRMQAGANVAVPRLVLAVLPARKEPAVVARYIAGEPLWLPAACTHVVLRRGRKGWLGWKEEEVLVDAGDLRAMLEPWKQPEAPAGIFGAAPAIGPRDPAWAGLSGSEARGLALVDWNDVVDR